MVGSMRRLGMPLLRGCLLVLVALSPLACGDDGEDEVVEEVLPPEEPPPADTRLFKRSRPLMSTVFEITVAGVTDDVAEPAVAAALNEIARLEHVLSEWRDDSEISEINASAGRSSVRVSEDTFRVIKAGVDVSRWSDGAFDLSWAALRGLYRFQPDDRHVPSRRELRSKLPLIDYQDIILNEEEQTVMLRRRGMLIGTGGIAKGYALDRASAILLEAGIENFMLFGGGQVQLHGHRGDRGWRVGILHPREQDYFAFIEATEGFISTSGDYERFFIDADGRRWHHILNPDTGMPASGSMSVTVLAPNGLYGDALSTACFILGAQKCIEMMADVPGGAEAVIVDSGFLLHITEETRERLHFTMELEDGRLPH